MLLEMRSSVLLSLVAALPAAHGVAFGGPEPTEAGPNRALDGMSPKPTNGPSFNELRKRQTGLYNTCGWLDGDICTSPCPGKSLDKSNMNSIGAYLLIWSNLHVV
jgi:hypothetical protein